jgi:hypothetical protein
MSAQFSAVAESFILPFRADIPDIEANVSPDVLAPHSTAQTNSVAAMVIESISLCILE